MIYDTQTIKIIDKLSYKPKKNIRDKNITRNILNDIEKEFIKIKLDYKTTSTGQNIESVKDSRNGKINKIISDNNLLKGNSYTISNLYNYIIENMNLIITYVFIVYDTVIYVNFVCYDDKQLKKIIELEYIRDVYTIIKFLIHNVSDSDRPGELNINIVLSDLKKYIPHLNNDNIIIYEPGNINSGVASKNNVLIYRQEEWFKVFIHELIHALNLDFSSIYNSNIQDIIKKNMEKRFNIASQWLIFETYTEIWACILNVIYTHYKLRLLERNNNKFIKLNKIQKQHKSRKRYKTKVITRKAKKNRNTKTIQEMINIEIKYSIFQTIKILWNSGLTYMDVIGYTNLSNEKIREKYKENTNVFCYYILKTILLYNYTNFIHFCIKNNKTNKNILDFDKDSNNGIILFDKLIDKLYKDENYLNDISKNIVIIEKMYNEYSGEKKYYYDELYRTMKMTFYG